MGNSQSNVKHIAITCKYKKTEFNQLLDLIRDAHDVTQFYSKYVLMESKDLPEKLEEYKNYNDTSEEYFNKTRKEPKDGLINLTTKVENFSYFQFYKYLEVFGSKSIYENNSNTPNNRKKLLEDVFNNCYMVQKLLIEDIWSSCDSQL